jgi:transposase
VFEDTVAWMATRTSKSTLEVLLRIAWRTVGAIVARVVDEGVAARDPLAGLARIGIDEISYKKGHRYITIVVDHDTGRLVWAAPGRDRRTLKAFFTDLGETRCAAISHVSADAAQWIADEVAAQCPNAVRCADAFHIVAWAGDALDQVRRDTWNAARKGGMSVHVRDLKGARYALWKNPENLTDRQQAKLVDLCRYPHRSTYAEAATMPRRPRRRPCCEGSGGVRLGIVTGFPGRRGSCRVADIGRVWRSWGW